MKCYDKYFLKKLGRNLDISETEFQSKIHETESEVLRSLPENFEYDQLVKLACEEFNISIDEYYSMFRKFGKVRQVVCYIMSIFGARTTHIANITGFKMSTISASKRIISGSYTALLHVEKIIEKLNINGNTE